LSKNKIKNRYILIMLSKIKISSLYSMLTKSFATKIPFVSKLPELRKKALEGAGK